MIVVFHQRPSMSHSFPDDELRRTSVGDFERSWDHGSDKRQPIDARTNSLTVMNQPNATSPFRTVLGFELRVS